MGASGWRLDVADELPDAFLDALAKRVKEKDPDALIIGEVWEDATNKFSYGVRRRYLLGEQLDTVMNYPWRTAIIDYIKDGDAALFYDRVSEILENYPPPSLCCLMNILSTHDTERIINAFGVQHEVPHHEAAHYRLTEEEYCRGKKRLMAATFLQFALPGIPSIYYGDEAGLCGFRDPYCRMGFPYGHEDVSLTAFFRTLGALRSAHRDDFSAPVDAFFVQGQSIVLMRGELIFVTNMGNCEENIKIESDFVIIYGAECLKKLENTITIPAQSYGILQKKPHKIQ